MRRCESVAATLSLVGVRSVGALAPDDVATIHRTVTLLDARRGAARRGLRRARSRAGRVRIVLALAAAHGRAARTLERLPAGPEARRVGAAVRRLRGVDRAYRGLASAARRGDRPGEQAARRGVRRRDLELRRAVERL